MLPIVKELFSWAPQLLPELLRLIQQIRRHPSPREALRRAAEVTAHEVATDEILRRRGVL